MTRLQQMRRWFDSLEHFARFLGVPVATLADWLSGRHHPNAAALRLIHVLEVIEASELHTVLVEQARPAPKPPRKRKVKAVAVHSDPELDAWVRERFPARPRAVAHTAWTDDFWRVRTLADAEAFLAGDEPEVTDGPATLGKMSDAQEQAYWAAMSDYCRRTGRHVPG